MAPVTSRELRPRKKAVVTAKGSCAVSTTTRRNKGGGISTTTMMRNKRCREQGKTTATRKKRVAQASNIQPGSDHNNYVESGSDHDNVNEPGSDDDNNVESGSDDDDNVESGSDDDDNVESGSDDDDNVESVSRDILVVDAKLIAVKVKQLTQKSLKDLETFLRRKGMSRDGGPYKDAIQKLKKGKTIDDKVGEPIGRYIYLLLSGFRAFLSTLIRVKDWDDEIVGEIIKFIKRELNEHLEVEVQEVQELLKIAEDVCSESDETWKLMKGKRLKNCVLNWVMNTKYLLTTSSNWGKKPTPSFRSFDEDYIDYDQAFPSGQGLFM